MLPCANLLSTTYDDICLLPASFFSDCQLKLGRSACWESILLLSYRTGRFHEVLLTVQMTAHFQQQWPGCVFHTGVWSLCYSVGRRCLGCLLCSCFISVSAPASCWFIIILLLSFESECTKLSAPPPTPTPTPGCSRQLMWSLRDDYFNKYLLKSEWMNGWMNSMKYLIFPAQSHSGLCKVASVFPNKQLGQDQSQAFWSWTMGFSIFLENGTMFPWQRTKVLLSNTCGKAKYLVIPF